MRRLIIVIALMILTAAGALPHGGVYRGPAGELPPNYHRRGPPPDEPEARDVALDLPRPVGYDSWQFWWAHAKEQYRGRSIGGLTGDEEAEKERAIRDVAYPTLVESSR